MNDLYDSNIWRQALRLVVPVWCAGCGRRDLRLCAPCQTSLQVTSPMRCEQHAARLDPVTQPIFMPVWSAFVNSEVVKSVIFQWKDHGRADLTPHLAQQCEQAARQLVPQIRGMSERIGDPSELRGPANSLWLVPVPSTARANRTRHGQLTVHLAKAFGKGLSAGGLSAEVAPMLRLSSSGRDQVGLGSRARQQNLQKRITLSRKLPAAARVILIDDVQTTGASLVAARNALQSQGVPVIAAFVLAYTPDPRLGTNDHAETGLSR